MITYILICFPFSFLTLFGINNRLLFHCLNKYKFNANLDGFLWKLYPKLYSNGKEYIAKIA